VNSRARLGVAIFATLCSLLGCATTVDAPGAPVTIVSDWAELKLQRAVSPFYNTQRVWLELDEPGVRAALVRRPSQAESDIVVRLPGRSDASVVFAEVRLADGTLRPLSGNWIGLACEDSCGCLSGCGIGFFGRFQRRDSIVAIRLRASTPIRVKKVSWDDFEVF
jgi:hypothetical protein